MCCCLIREVTQSAGHDLSTVSLILFRWLFSGIFWVLRRKILVLYFYIVIHFWCFWPISLCNVIWWLFRRLFLIVAVPVWIPGLFYSICLYRSLLLVMACVWTYPGQLFPLPTRSAIPLCNMIWWCVWLLGRLGIFSFPGMSYCPRISQRHRSQWSHVWAILSFLTTLCWFGHFRPWRADIVSERKTILSFLVGNVSKNVLIKWMAFSMAVISAA